jgi:hypothetical protein
MFTDSICIKNEYKSIKNPAKLENVTSVYQGPLTDNFDFKFQKKNFECIKKSLEPFGIIPKDIYYAEIFGKSTFVVTWSDSNIFWRKYEGKASGSGQNYIYYKNKQINTTVWIKDYSQEKIYQLMN